jgi:hypothetical protein
MQTQALRLFAAIVVLAPSLSAQSGATASRPASAPATDSRPVVTIPVPPADGVERAGPTTRPKSESRPTILYHAKVQVLLKNGQKLQGIVKNNRFVERSAGLGFAVATKDDPMSGLRLWFTSPGQNWLFLNYRDIQAVDMIGRVSDIEVREMEAKLDQEMNQKLAGETAQRVAEVQAELKARDDARKADQEASDKAKKDEAKKKLKEEVEAAKKVVNRFPPDDGWGEDRKKEILAKKANHVYPTPDEAEFIKSYAEWEKARKVLEKAEKIEKGEINPEDEESSEEQSEQKPKKKPAQGDGE